VRRPCSFTCTDHELAEMLGRIPYPVKGDTIDNLSRLIVFAVKRLPKQK
jgi:hypothetical protein